MTANGLAASERLASFVAAWNAAGFRTRLFGLNQLALLLRLGFPLRFGKRVHLRRRINALHAAAFDLHDDFAPLILGLVEIQQAVHAAIRALAVAFLERTRVNERECPMLELELVPFRQLSLQPFV